MSGTESLYPCVAMVFDAETANAIDSFDYTPEELERRAKELREQMVTIEPNPFGITLNGR